jgi:hypothetical protein
MSYTILKSYETILIGDNVDSTLILFALNIINNNIEKLLIFVSFIAVSIYIIIRVFTRSND